MYLHPNLKRCGFLVGNKTAKLKQQTTRTYLSFNKD
jgi:hypothetical protein